MSQCRKFRLSGLHCRQLLLLERLCKRRQIARQRIEVDFVRNIDLSDPFRTNDTVTVQRPGQGAGHARDRVVIAVAIPVLRTSGAWANRVSHRLDRIADS